MTDSDVRWVRQEESKGCGIACVAMLTGHTYKQVREYFHDRQDGQISTRDLDGYLAEQGIAVARKFRWHRGADRSYWPPFLCNRTAIAEVLIEGAPVNHFVVVLPDGSVMDPLTEDRKSLKDYHQVHNVALLVRV